MADPRFPAILPIPVRDGYGRSYQKPKKILLMDDGSRREYSEYFSKPIELQVTWKLASAKELAIFEAFIKYELNYGVSFFELIVEPNKPAMRVQFTEDAPTQTPNGMGFDVSAKLLTIIPGVSRPAQISLGVWPANLPLPLKESYSLQMDNPATVGTINKGMPTVRNRFQTKYTSFDVSWIFTAAERDLFWQFYRETLLDGSVPLNFPFYNGMGINTVRATFAEHPKEAEKGAGFTISASMFTRDVPGMTRDEYTDALGGVWQGDYAIDYFAEDYTVEVFIPA